MKENIIGKFEVDSETCLPANTFYVLEQYKRGYLPFFKEEEVRAEHQDNYQILLIQIKKDTKSSKM